MQRNKKIVAATLQAKIDLLKITQKLLPAFNEGAGQSRSLMDKLAFLVQVFGHLSGRARLPSNVNSMTIFC